MFGFLEGYGAVDKFFFVCATVGGIFFLVRLVIQFMGMDHDMDAGGADGAGAGGIEHAGGDMDGHADSDVGFKLLTFQGLTAFFMMFGLVGLAIHQQSGMGALLAMVGGTAAGLASVWVIDKMFSAARGLQSSGTLDNTSAIGGIGSVYLTIPKGGTGRVMITFHDRQREFDAVAQDKEEIKTGERVKVVWADGGVLVVEKFK